jgi:hypothetical protein
MLSAFSVNWLVPATRTGTEKLPETNTPRNKPLGDEPDDLKPHIGWEFTIREPV